MECSIGYAMIECFGQVIIAIGFVTDSHIGQSQSHGYYLAYFAVAYVVSLFWFELLKKC